MRPFLTRSRRRLAVALGILLALLLVSSAMLDHLDRFLFFGGPVIEVMTPRQPMPAKDGIGVVLLSGDMGLRVGLSPRVGARLARAGYPVIAINSLAFAGDGRTPDEIAALIGQATDQALARPGVRRVVLLGQSFGADLLQVGASRLPPAVRAKLAAIILAVPTDKVYLTAGFREYFDLGAPDVAALDTARRLDWLPVTCIRGEEETTSLCPLLKMPNVRQMTLPGGHKLNRDDAALFAAISGAIAHHRR